MYGMHVSLCMIPIAWKCLRRKIVASHWFDQVGEVRAPDPFPALHIGDMDKTVRICKYIARRCICLYDQTCVRKMLTEEITLWSLPLTSPRNLHKMATVRARCRAQQFLWLLYSPVFISVEVRRRNG